MRILLFLFLIMTAANLFGQSTDYTIRISAVNHYGGEFMIDINKTGDNLKLVYWLLDSVAYHALNQDKQYIATNKKMLAMVKLPQINRDSLPILSNKLHALIEQYSRYSKDSITVSADINNWYVKLIEKIYAASDEQLESTIPYTSKLISEGVHFKIEIQNNGLNRTIYTISPTTVSNPLLSDFIHQTTFLYRKTRQTGFLNNRTSGY